MLQAFKNLKLGKKLYLGFTLVLVILVVLSVLTYTNFSKLYDAITWDKHTYEVLMNLQSVTEEMVNMETGQRGFSLTGDEKSLEPFNTGKINFDKYYNKVKELTSDNPTQQELMSKLKNVQSEWLKTAEDAIKNRRNVENGIGSIDDIIREEQLAKGKAMFDEFRRLIAESKDIESTLLETRSQESERLQVSTSYTIFLGTGLAVVLALLVASFITKSITKPINKIKEIAQRIADGDLNASIHIQSKDEIGELAQVFLQMTDNLNDVLSNINSSSEQVASGSKQLSDSSIVLSQGATEQASSIEELTASLEEVASQTRLNAQNANNANELAENAKSDAMHGNAQMKEMLKAMEDINESSANISKIIKVIDDIAFQTNILALNAAVEAARAGQHGKGFAVVAEEVRNLAARSANAAKETTDMIEGSIKKSEGGTRIAKETAEALNKILEGSDKVAGLVNGIAVASNEQALGIEQINQGIIQVSQVVQTNSATSQESAAASEELSSQASVLKEMVSKFKLKTNIKTYNRLDELNPEIIKMLEEMSDRKKQKNNHDDAYSEPSVSKSKIVLNDKEFGKY